MIHAPSVVAFLRDLAAWHDRQIAARAAYYQLRDEQEMPSRRCGCGALILARKRTCIACQKARRAAADRARYYARKNA